MWAAIIILMILAIVALATTHKSCFGTNNEPTDSGRFGWRATLAAAILSFIGVLWGACWLLKFSYRLLKKRNPVMKPLKTKAVVFTTCFLVIACVLVVVTGISLNDSHDSCYDGATTNRSAWWATAICIPFQICIIAALLHIYPKNPEDKISMPRLLGFKPFQSNVKSS